jgi:hypothetical protein
MAKGVFNSWAAEAKASRQQLQYSSVTCLWAELTGDMFTGMGITLLAFREWDGESWASSGVIPDLCSTGILSAKVSPGFSYSPFLGK